MYILLFYKKRDMTDLCGRWKVVQNSWTANFASYFDCRATELKVSPPLISEFSQVDRKDLRHNSTLSVFLMISFLSPVSNYVELKTIPFRKSINGFRMKIRFLQG